MHRVADLLVEEGLASPEGGEVRAVIAMRTDVRTPESAEALHVIVPRAIPQSPDLGANYSPN
jgi:hypothetical protein